MPDPVTAQLSLFEFAPADPVRAAGMLVPRWTSLVAWHAELDHQTVIMRARSTLYARFETTARLLTTGRIRETRDIAAIERLVERLSAARFPWGHDLHDLDRVWSRAEFGTLLVEATNRLQLLRMGRLAPKPKGPRLDPARIPLGKLEALIQSHSDMAVVDACRAERNRRLIEERGTTSGR